MKLIGGGGNPFPGLDERGYPIQLMGGTPFQVQAGGIPIQLTGVPIQLMVRDTPAGGIPTAGVPRGRGIPTNQSSIACNCYVAGGMPLAFSCVFKKKLFCRRILRAKHW